MHAMCHMNTPNLISLLRICTTSKSILQGQLVHQKIITLGLPKDTTLCKYLINFYFSCNLYNYASLVFRTMGDPLDISLWNGLFAAYTKNSMFFEALELFQKLLRYPCMNPDSYTYPSILRACGEVGSVSYGKVMHAHLVKTGFLSDVFASSSLLTMYAKCNALKCANQLFEEIPERDVTCWNAMISCYYQHGRPEMVVEFLEKMKSDGFEPNSVTLTVAISSCARLLDLERGKGIHKEAVESGLLSDGFVRSSLVDMYGKCGCLEMAKEVFEQIPRKNVVAWNSIIAGYSLKGDSKYCIKLFERMINEGTKATLTTFSSMLSACTRSVQLQHGKFIHGCIVRNNIQADIYIYNLLIDLYFKCGIVLSAKNIFEKIPKPDSVSWNVMISGFVTVGNYFEALVIYDTMKKVGVRPDSITFTSVLPACSQLAALEKGKEIHTSIIQNKFENDEKVMAALLDMYAKCGDVDEAFEVFHRLPERDLVSWTSMITAYGSHGRAIEALRLFREMQQSNERPDGVAFLAVLSACSHAGLIDEGCNYFNQMINEYRIKPSIEHYSCLLDLLGRAGRLREAYQILRENTEIREEVDLLSTLLSACRLHEDFDLGVQVANLLIEKSPDDASTYVSLSNIYASDKKWHELRKLRLKMKKLGLRKNPGCSWVEINKKIHTFFLEDNSHPQAETIYECLRMLYSHMEKDDLYPNESSNPKDILC